MKKQLTLPNSKYLKEVSNKKTPPEATTFSLYKLFKFNNVLALTEQVDNLLPTKLILKESEEKIKDMFLRWHDILPSKFVIGTERITIKAQIIKSLSIATEDILQVMMLAYPLTEEYKMVLEHYPGFSYEVCVDTDYKKITNIPKSIATSNQDEVTFNLNELDDEYKKFLFNGLYFSLFSLIVNKIALITESKSFSEVSFAVAHKVTLYLVYIGIVSYSFSNINTYIYRVIFDTTLQDILQVTNKIVISSVAFTENLNTAFAYYRISWFVSEYTVTIGNLKVTISNAFEDLDFENDSKKKNLLNIFGFLPGDIKFRKKPKYWIEMDEKLFQTFSMFFAL